MPESPLRDPFRVRTVFGAGFLGGLDKPLDSLAFAERKVIKQPAKRERGFAERVVSLPLPGAGDALQNPLGDALGVIGAV